jgi:thioredoxin reductase (NADPH)
LIEGGQTDVPFFVLKAGEIEVIRPSGLGDLLIAVLRPAQFTGDVSMILGRPAQMRLTVSSSGEVVQLTRDQMHALIQTDAEISEVLMGALIHRRIAMVAEGIGDALLIGSGRSAATLRIKEFLTRNGHPFKYLDLDRDADVQDLLDRFHVDRADVPVLICRGAVVLKRPSNQEIADRLGFNERIDKNHLRDVVIVGGGPAGLAAAVYASSEGLDALVIEASSPGGQAGSSSNIENYLGFPTGISGRDLAGRAFAQAQKFGADIMIARGVTNLACDRKPLGVILDDGTSIQARTVIIATGARYRKPSLANLEQFEGAGVYYSATFMEAQLCAAMRSSWWAARTRPARRPCFWPGRFGGFICWFGPTISQGACRDTSSVESRTLQAFRSEREPSSWLSMETDTLNVSRGATAPAPSRVTRSSTCS